MRAVPNMPTKTSQRYRTCDRYVVVAEYLAVNNLSTYQDREYIYKSIRDFFSLVTHDGSTPKYPHTVRVPKHAIDSSQRHLDPLTHL